MGMAQLPKMTASLKKTLPPEVRNYLQGLRMYLDDLVRKAEKGRPSALYLDSSDQVGVNTTSPTKTLDVSGTFGVSGAVALASTLNVVGNFSVNTSYFTVTASNGNTSIAGTLAVSDKLTIEKDAAENVCEIKSQHSQLKLTDTDDETEYHLFSSSSQKLIIRSNSASANIGIIQDATGQIGIGDSIPSDAPACALDVYGGAIRSGSTTLSSSTDALDVSACNCVDVSTSGGNVTIGGLANGILGQVVHIYKTTSANDLIIENNEGTGTQKIFLKDGADLTLSTYGGVTLAFNGTYWFEVSR